MPAILTSGREQLIGYTGLNHEYWRQANKNSCRHTPRFTGIEKSVRYTITRYCRWLFAGYLLRPAAVIADPLITPAGIINFVESIALILIGIGITLLFLHKRQQRNRELDFSQRLDALPHIVWRTNTQNGLLNLSGAFGRLTGKSPASASINDWIDVIHPDDRQRAEQLWGDAMEHGHPFLTDFRMRMADGSYRYFESQGIPIVDGKDEISEWIGTIIDIHDRKLGEIALREKDVNLRLAVEGANIGFWSWNIDDNSMRFSEQWQQQLGLANKSFPHTAEFFQFLIHPDDLGNVMALKKAIEKNPRSHHSLEYRLQHADGTYRWMLSPATAIENPQSKTVSVVGANIDITDRKVSRQHLEYQAS